MKKLIFFLMILSAQSVFAQWEKTNWKSDSYIFKIMSADNFVILENNSNTISISNDYGKSFLKNISGLSNEIRVYCMVVQDSIVFIGTDSGLFSSSDNGYNWINKSDGFQYDKWIDFIAVIDDYLFINLGYDGILLSSDKGDSWKSINNDFNVFDICSFFAIENNLVTITDECQKLLVSTDLGQTWIEKTEKPEQYLRYNNYAVNDSILYYISNTDFNDGFQFRFYSSSDLGTTWNTKPFSLDSSDRISDFAIIVDRIIIGTEYNIYYSDDFGDSWVKSSLIENGERGAYQFTVSKDIIYASSGTEFYYSSDSGENWIPRLNSLNYGSINSIISIEDKIYVCTTPIEFCTTFQDGLYMSSDKGNSWIRKGPEGIKINTMAVNDNKLYAGSDNGLYISSDDGISWNELIFGPYYDNLIRTIIFHNDKLYVVTSENIYLSMDKGIEWDKLINSTSFASKENILSAIIKDNLIILGLYKGVYISTDYGKTWDKKNNGLPIPEAYSAELNVNSVIYDGNIISIGTYYGVFNTIDLGQNWIPKNTGISKNHDKYYYVETILQIKNYLITATGYGEVYYSSDQGETWNDTNCEILALSSIAVNEESIYVGKGCNYYLGYTAELHKAKLSDLGITDVKEYNTKSDFRIFPNPAEDFITVQTLEGSNVQIFDVLGLEVKSVGTGLDLSTQRIDISHLPSGVYFIKIGDRFEKFVKM